MTSAGCARARNSNCERPHAGRDSEQAFLSSQQPPPDQRGISFEALFFRQLQAVTTRIHATENICRLFNADRLTLYAVNEDRTAIVSKVKTGLNTSRDLPFGELEVEGATQLCKTLATAIQ